MGCKESKNKAVAEGNTIITPSSSRKSMTRGQSSSIKNNAPSLQRSRSTRSSIQKQDSLKKINVGDSKASNVLKQNENAGYEKGTVNVSKVLEGEDRRLKELNDQIAKSEEKALMKGKNDVGVETNVEKKEDENVENADQEKEKESVVIPKVNLSSSSRKDGEGIESIITDGLSGTSVYYTPTEASGPFANNTKTDNDDEKQEPGEETQESTEEKEESIEDIKEAKSAEGVAEDNTIKTVDDATPVNNVEGAEVAEKNPIETDGATSGNQEKESQVAEKIKVAEAAIAALETLVKEADTAEDTDAAVQNPVNDSEDTPVTEGKISDATLEKPVIEADKSDIIRQTEIESTDATLQNPEQEADKSEEITEIEPEATDATLSYPVIESDKAEESLLKADAEAVENGVKEIHEVADKVEENPAKEAESTDPSDHKNQELVSDKTEDVQGKEAEVAYVTPEDPVKEVGVADQVKSSVTEAEADSINEENPVNKLENMTKDEATEEDTKNSSTANVHQIST